MNIKYFFVFNQWLDEFIDFEAVAGNFVAFLICIRVWPLKKKKKYTRMNSKEYGNKKKKARKQQQNEFCYFWPILPTLLPYLNLFCRIDIYNASFSYLLPDDVPLTYFALTFDVLLILRSTLFLFLDRRINLWRIKCRCRRYYYRWRRASRRVRSMKVMLA